jgi:Family of unknown function (DUF6390)
VSAAGAVLFAQFAYPPNELGHCGPPGAAAMLRGDEVSRLEARARRFEGAWSYLEALAAATGTPDPLDEALVEAYWVGNELLDSVDPLALVAHLEQRFRGQSGGTWRAASGRAVAHHAFQVYEVYPWVGLLREGRRPGPAVQVVDDCRIRVGTVREVSEDGSVQVACRRLAWDEPRLDAGPYVTERARWLVDGAGLIAAPSVGDLVALHWDWVCGVVTPAQADQIEARDRAARVAIGLA